MGEDRPLRNFSYMLREKRRVDRRETSDREDYSETIEVGRDRGECVVIANSEVEPDGQQRVTIPEVAWVNEQNGERTERRGEEEEEEEEDAIFEDVGAEKEIRSIDVKVSNAEMSMNELLAAIFKNNEENKAEIKMSINDKLEEHKAEINKSRKEDKEKELQYRKEKEEKVLQYRKENTEFLAGIRQIVMEIREDMNSKVTKREEIQAGLKRRTEENRN